MECAIILPFVLGTVWRRAEDDGGRRLERHAGPQWMAGLFSLQNAPRRKPSGAALRGGLQEALRSISKQLKERRLRAGLSLARLAALTDTSPSALCRYENGWDRFEVHTLEKLATALNCRLEIQLRPIRAIQTRPTKENVKRQLQRLFWDQRLTDARLKSHPTWVLERVLDSGRIEDVHVLRDFWGRELFLDRVAQCRFFSARTRHFWMNMLQKEGKSCTRKFSRETAFNS